MTNVGGASNTYEAQSRNMMNICIKYGFDILIISGSYDGHKRHMMYDGRRMTYDGPTNAEQRHRYGISSPQVS